jgi:hypothetical protein
MYNKEIVSLIWSGYRDLEIIRHRAPGTDREERELEKAIRETRSAIEDLKRDLPGILEIVLREGKFTMTQVFDVITEKGQGLIPPFDLECLISKAQNKIDGEKQAAQEAIERAQAEVRRAAIQKRIDDALAALRATGAQL